MQAKTVPTSVRTPLDDGVDGEIERHVVRPTDSHDVEIDENDQGQTLLTVPVSSTSEMRSGHVIAESFQKSMVDQLEAGTVGMWDDHGLDEYGWPEYRREDLYGAWVGGEFDDDDVLLATVRLRDGDPRSDDLVDQIKQGMPVGFSIGYIVHEDEWVEREDGERREILDGDLLEISPVGIPDNSDAYATAGRMVAHSLAESDVELNRETATTLAASVRDGLTQMTNNTDDTDDTDNASDDDVEQNDEPTDTHQDTEEVVAAIVGIFQSHHEQAIEDVDEWLEENAGSEASKDGKDDEEEDEYGDDDDEEDAHDDDDDDDEHAADVEALRAELSELREEKEELRATVDRIESESRESRGRKGRGITPAETDNGDPDETETQTEPSGKSKPGNAMEEAQILQNS